VVGEHPRDLFPGRIDPVGAAREQHLLLDLEVAGAVLGPEREDVLADLLLVVRRGAPRSAPRLYF
jgi:hypothetical protein